MLRPMIFLTIDAAIFHEFTSGAYLQFDVVARCDSTRGTHLIGLYAVHSISRERDLTYALVPSIMTRWFGGVVCVGFFSANEAVANFSPRGSLHHSTSISLNSTGRYCVSVICDFILLICL